MQPHRRIHASLVGLGLGAILALGFVTQTHAQDKKADPAGTWTWTTPGRNGGPDRKMTLKIKVEGDKITGKIITPGRDGANSEADIEDAKLKGDELSFTVVREFNGNKMTSKYNGKVTAESIKGKVETKRGDNDPQSRDWEAKRDTAKKEQKD